MGIGGVGEGAGEDRKGPLDHDPPLTLVKEMGRKQGWAGRGLDCSGALRTSWAGCLQIKVSRLMSLVSCRNKPAFHGHCQGPAHGKEALECVGGLRGPTAGTIRQFCFPHQEIGGTCFHGHHNHDSKVFGKTESLPSLCKGLSAFSVFCSFFSTLAASALPCHTQSRKHPSAPRLPLNGPR